MYNNGKGIPIVIHKEHHVYVPELVFGAPTTQPAPVAATKAPRNPSRLARRRPCPRPSSTVLDRPARRACAQATCSRAATFNDDQNKVTGGRNGYGAKLAIIYATES